MSDPYNNPDFTEPPTLPEPVADPPALPEIMEAEAEVEVPELPDAVEMGGGDLPVLEKGRVCPTCEGEARIVSNSNGVSGHCVKCKSSWPLSAASLRPSVPVATPRGISKQTLVEPDWNIAFDDIGGGSDPTRPKK